MKFKAYTAYYRTIGKLALPLFIGQLGNIAVSFADNIMVGQYSTASLASASFVNNIFNIAILSSLGFTFGLTPLLGALYAKNENARIGSMIRTGLKVNVVFTTLVMLLLTLLYFNLERLGQPAELMPLIKPYFIIVGAGMLPLAIFNVWAQWSYAIGNTALPTVILISCNVLNVIGNYALIYGNWGAPELGLFGAGISTLLSRILGMIVMLGIFFAFRSYTAYRKGFLNEAARSGDTREVIRTGFPVSMQMSFETGSFSGCAIFAGWLGAVPLAAFQIVVISGMLGFCLYYSIGSAAAIPISHAAGRGDRQQMRRMAWASYHIMLVMMTLSSLIFIFGGSIIMGWFSQDTAVRALAVSLIFPMVLYQFGDATQVTFANALRGTSHVQPMLYIAFVSYIVVGLPLAWFLAFPAGLEMYGIVLSFSVSLFMAAALYFYYFMKVTNKSYASKI